MQRIVANIYSNDMEKSRQFYIGFLGMDLAMDMGWILTFVSKENQTAQISILGNERGKPLDNSAIFLSIEVSDIDHWYERAKAQKNRDCISGHERKLGRKTLFCKGSERGDP